MKRVAFTYVRELIDKATQLATDVEPWADVVECSLEDYLEAGLRGRETVIPVQRPLTFADWNRPHLVPGTDTYICWNEAGKSLPPMSPWEGVHRLRLVPTRDIDSGKIQREMP